MTSEENPSSSQDEESDIFYKRKGTTDLGKDYEDIKVAQILLTLVESEDVDDFKVWSNDEKYGSFDDVIAVISTKKGDNLKVAIQLKHSQDEKILATNSLECDKGDFSIQKYFKSYEKAKQKNGFLEDYKFFLQTNKSTYEISNEVLILTNDFELKPEFTNEQLIEYLGNNPEAKPLKFSIIKESEKESSEKFGKFLERFYFYPKQPNLQATTLLATASFLEKFLGSDPKPFFDFVSEWSKKDGKKYKLSKKFICAKLAECLVSPFLINLSENKEQLYEKCRFSLLINSIEKFEATVIDVEYLTKLGQMMVHQKEEIDLNHVNETGMKFGIIHKKLAQISDLDEKQLHKILWHLNKSYFVVSLTPDNIQILSKVLSLCRAVDGRKFILVGNTKTLQQLPEGDILTNFEDLYKEDEELCNEIGDSFRISLGGKNSVQLNNILDNEDVRRSLTSSQLLHMVYQDLLIGGKGVELPDYIQRTVTNFVIDLKFLLKMDIDKNIALIYSSSDLAKIRTKIPLAGLDEDGSKIYFCNIAEKENTFDVICYNNPDKNCHCFEFIEGNDALIWRRSNKNIDELRDYHNKERLLIPEELLVQDDNYGINLICGEPGMGKTWLLKKLEASYPSMLTIRIEAKIQNFFSRKANNKQYEEFLSSIASHKQISQSIFKHLYIKKRIIIFWDGLDEMSDKKYPNVLDAIDYFSTKGLRQWLASRTVLQKELERRFNILSRTIEKLTENQQEEYIKKRLQQDASSLYDIIKNILSKLKSKYVNELFGIPLQLFMLTELFLDPDSNIRETLSGNLFSISTLYEHFLEGKFRHHDEKTGLASLAKTNDQAAAQLSELRENREDNYERAALRACISEEFEDVNFSADTFLEEMGKRDHYGIIISVEETVSIENTLEKIAIFEHISYAEFLAAKYLTKNYIEIKSLDRWFFKKGYKNIRFFFDALMVGESELHLAVLYKDVGKVKELEKNPDCKDLAGRNPLNLACSWGDYHYFIWKLIRDDSRNDENLSIPSVPTDEPLKEILMMLSQQYSVKELDNFGFTARTYTTRLAETHLLAVGRRDHLDKLPGIQSEDEHGTLYKTFYDSCIH